MLVSPEQIAALYQCPFVRAATFSPHLNAAMWHAAIVTPARIRAFLAQVGHESGRLRWLREIWGPTTQQRRYERNFSAPWPESAAEAKRAEFAANRLAYTLGNSEAGDGARFKGRGLIQTTGRANYQRLSEETGQDFLVYPGILERHEWACLSAAAFWERHNLNALADAGKFDAITKRINGGQTGRADRVALHERARKIIT